MKKHQEDQIPEFAKLSPVYEKVMQEGRGFAGFTILYKNGEFENFVRFFSSNTHDEVLEAVKTRYQIWTASIHTNNLEE